MPLLQSTSSVNWRILETFLCLQAGNRAPLQLEWLQRPVCLSPLGSASSPYSVDSLFSHWRLRVDAPGCFAWTIPRGHGECVVCVSTASILTASTSLQHSSFVHAKPGQLNETLERTLLAIVQSEKDQRSSFSHS